MPNKKIAHYLSLGSVEAIVEDITDDTALDGPNGRAAVFAATVLEFRRIDSTLVRLEQASSKLTWLTIALAVVAIGVTAVQLFLE